MTDYATLEKIDDVSVLSLDDGKVNVFSIEMLEAINNCLNDVPKDSGSLVTVSYTHLTLPTKA